MILTKRSLKTGNEKEDTDVGNQLIISSTANFEGSDFHEKVVEYQEEMDKGDEDYEIISYDYKDGLKAEIFEEKIVKKKVENADSITRKQEYLNIFVSSSGDFIPYSLIQEKAVDNEEDYNPKTEEYSPPETQLEFEQKLDEDGLPKNKYILAADDADTMDDFAWALLKLDDNKVKRVVNVGSYNSAPIQQKIKKIRELLSNFNIVRIVLDQRHQNITDNLAEPYETGESNDPILIIDNEEQREYVKRQYPHTNPKELIHIHNFTNSSNEARAKMFLGDIEQSKFKIPAEIGLETKKEVEMYKKVKEAISQIISIQPEVAGKHIKYDTRGRQKKDLFTVFELGNWMANEYMKKQNDNEEDIYIGKWA